MKPKNDLIYELIFSEKKTFSIIVSDYVEDIYTYDYFIDEIKEILFKSKVFVVKESIKVTTDEVKWNLKVKR